MILQDIYTMDDYRKFESIMLPIINQRANVNDWKSTIRFDIAELRDLLKESFPDVSNRLTKHFVEFTQEMFNEMGVNSYYDKNTRFYQIFKESLHNLK